MVVLGSEVRLLSVDAATFLGVTRGPTEADILITNSNSVLLYELSSQKQSISWNTSYAENQQLTTPCCYDVSTQRFVAAFHNMMIRNWASEDDRLESGKKVGVPHSVQAIIPCIESDAGAVVIYENGDVAFLHHHEPTAAFEANSGDRRAVQFPYACSGENKTHVCYLSIYEKEIVFRHITFDASHVMTSYMDRPVQREGLTLKDAHIAWSSNDSLDLTLLWSDSSLSLGKVDPTTSEILWRHLSPVKEINCIHLVAITVLNNDVIAVFLNDVRETTCVIFNTKYEAVTWKTCLKSRGEIAYIHLYNIGGQIYLLLGNDILFLPYSDETSTLASVLGVRMEEQTKKALGLDRTLTWSTDGLAECQRVMTDSKQDKATFSGEFLKLVTELEDQGKSEQTICTTVIGAIQAAKDFGVLSEALTYFKNIPESSLVDALLCYLSSEIECENILRDAGDQLKIDCQHRNAIVDQILSMPINDIFLLDHVRKLRLEETVWLLWYLRYLLKQQGSLNVAKKPDVMQIVDWINMLLDAHFHQLLLVKNEGLCSFLHGLSSLVAAQVKFLEDQSMLQHSMTMLLTKGRQYYETKLKMAYGIETLIF